jgi:predicted HicB family RNase H-like nuclease
MDRVSRKGNAATKSHKEKSESMTLRLKCTVVRKLKREASQRQVSPNTLAAQVLTMLTGIQMLPRQDLLQSGRDCLQDF